MKPSVLIVEDEPNIASLVRMYLEKEGFRVSHVADGLAAVDTIGRLEPSVVVLDVMLPGIDGLEVCRRVRQRSRVPIIMLTAKDEEIDKVLGLELGADDYLTKPFSPRELVARVKALLRRAGGEESPASTVKLGEVTLDEQRRSVEVDGKTVDLTAKEFDLLAFLMTNPKIVFSRDRLLERVWGYERAVDSRTVDSHVRSLRSKLGSAELIKTVRGVGYKAED